ncbi:MAG: hypothetical protein WDO71_04465 [Bacteroidota bacterium]
MLTRVDLNMTNGVARAVKEILISDVSLNGMKRQEALLTYYSIACLVLPPAIFWTVHGRLYMYAA